MEITLSERRLKEMAKTLRAGLPETARPTYTQTLDLLASVFGQRTFAALKAQIEPVAETQPATGDADSRPFTVIVSDDRDDDLVYSVQLEWERDAENAGATGRISAVDHEFPEDPAAWDDDTEERWEHAMDHVHPAIVLLGHPETGRPARTAYPQAWTVVMTYREPSGAGGFQHFHKTTGVRHVMARSEDEARRFAGHRVNQDLTGSSFGGVEVTVIAALAGMLTPDGEEADEQRDPGLPVLVIEMAHGRIDSITADRAMRLLVVETDSAADVHLPADATRSDVERTLDQHTPAWRAPDRIEVASLVEDRGASWIAETRRKLSQQLDAA